MDIIVSSIGELEPDRAPCVSPSSCCHTLTHSRAHRHIHSQYHHLTVCRAHAYLFILQPTAESADAAAAGNTGASKKLHVAQTLEKNIGSITVKKFDMEFDVDPLFHKMSKAFDSGGARGMLLNNLVRSRDMTRELHVRVVSVKSLMCNVALMSAAVLSSFSGGP